MTETHFGGCACGAVRYRVQGNPVLGTVCHCRFCQKRLASAFAVLASFKEDAIETPQGAQSEVECHSDERGRWLQMSFCPKCGPTPYIAENSLRNHPRGTQDLAWKLGIAHRYVDCSTRRHHPRSMKPVVVGPERRTMQRAQLESRSTRKPASAASCPESTGNRPLQRRIV